MTKKPSKAGSRRGPAPKSTKLRVLAGTLKESQGKGNVNLETKQMPRVPKFLSKDARVEWRKAVKEIKRLGILASADYAVLALYCITLVRLQRAEMTLELMAESDPKKHALIIASAKGNPIANPLIQIIAIAARDVAAYAAQLGMTPASRLRLNAQEGEKKKNSFAELDDKVDLQGR